jgi:glutaconate CoA-transferase subunit B
MTTATPAQGQFTVAEHLAAMGSRQLKDRTAVFAGVGVPLLAAVLAQKTHAPRLTIVVEGGVIGTQVAPGRLPISTNEMRGARRAIMVPNITDTFLFAQRGFIDYGFLGGAQIDRYGNLNTTALGTYDRPKVRLPGSGGAADIIALCREILVLTFHERRRFVDKVDFITSPANLQGGGSRRKAGLIFGRVSRVVTNLGILGFDEGTGAMRLEALHPGVTVDDVRKNTGFELIVPSRLETTEPPTNTELEILRSVDPERRFLA